MELTKRTLAFGPYELNAPASGGTPSPVFLPGRRMYVVGMSDGSIQPIGAEHLVGEMGGVWAHPVKVADGVTCAIAGADGRELEPAGATLTESLSHVTWRYTAGDLAVARSDFVVEDRPVACALLRLTNEGDTRREGRLIVRLYARFLGCWFGGMPAGGGVFWYEDGAVLGYDRRWQDRWGLAFGANAVPERCEFDGAGERTIATLTYPFALAPGETRAWDIMLAANSQRGHTAARAALDQLSGSGEQLLREKIAAYERQAFDELTLETPDADLNRGFVLARANLHMLQANYPDLPPYFLAGIPEYPQLFGCDLEYSVPGAAAAGFAPQMRGALGALAGYAERACGRVPHEVTTNGRVFHPGNTQETPQFASACWDFVRWTGDLEFLGEVYPICQQGVDEYLPALWSGQGTLYPIGDGVVERLGMGSRKLDSACYLYQALRALAAMAEALRLPDDAARYSAHADDLRARFEEDWWIEAEGMYADSLHTDMTPQLDGHWTVVLPLQLGLASPERARRAFGRIEREWVNQWGLVHTRGREELVWTLPTGLLALTAFEMGAPDLGLRLLRNIAVTAEHGTLGALKELIPIGLCFVQLWSSGLLLQGVFEGLLGIKPLAHAHQVTLDPRLPEGWPEARLRGLPLGAHHLDLRLAPDGAEITHRAGPRPLTITYRLPEGAGAPPEAARFSAENGATWITFDVAPGEIARISALPEQTEIAITGKEVMLAQQPETSHPTIGTPDNA